MLSAVHGHKADRGFAKSSEDLVEDIGRRKTRRQHLPPTLSIWGSTASRPLPRSRGCVFISQVSFPSARRCRAARRLSPGLLEPTGGTPSAASDNRSTCDVLKIAFILAREAQS